MKLWMTILLLASMYPANSMAESLCYKGGNFFWTQQKKSCDSMAAYEKFQTYFGRGLETQTDSEFYCHLVLGAGDAQGVDCIMNRTRAQLVDYVAGDAKLSKNQALVQLLQTAALSPSELRLKKQTDVEYGAADWKAEAQQMEDSAAGR